MPPASPPREVWPEWRQDKAGDRWIRTRADQQSHPKTSLIFAPSTSDRCPNGTRYPSPEQRSGYHTTQARRSVGTPHNLSSLTTYSKASPLLPPGMHGAQTQRTNTSSASPNQPPLLARKQNGTQFPRCRPQNLSPTAVDQREYNSTINCSFTIGSISSRLGSRFTVPDSLSRSCESQSGTTIACVMSSERSPIC